MSKDDYDVGYGRPPKHTRFVKGESGNSGRKKKRPELQAEIVARVRDEGVTVNGTTMTMFELSLRTIMTSTIKRGNPRDLKILFDVLDKHGALPKIDVAADSRAAADEVIKKMMGIFDRQHNIDPVDTDALDKLRGEEAAIVMKCVHCSPVLRERWSQNDRKALSKRLGGSGLQQDIDSMKKRQ